MATTLYKINEKGEIETVRVETDKVQGCLNAGYVPSIKEVKKPSPVDEATEEEKQDAADKVIKEANEESTRAEAKEKKIRNWHNKKLSTLKSELGYDES